LDTGNTVDGIAVAVNTLSAIALLAFILLYFVQSHDGSPMTYIMIQGGGSDFGINYAVYITAPIALAVIFFLTQIYLNLRAITKRPQPPTKTA